MLPGLGTVLAAKLLGHVGDVTRFPSEHHFASYTGTAPLDASSGKNTRHRLNTGGNRALNSVLHIIAICQIRDGGRGQEHYLRKIAEGKTPAEARRALKRRLSNVVYRTLKREHDTALTCGRLTHRGTHQRLRRHLADPVTPPRSSVRQGEQSCRARRPAALLQDRRKHNGGAPVTPRSRPARPGLHAREGADRRKTPERCSTSSRSSSGACAYQ
ncbi:MULTISPECIES: IS110 family transposase [Streptomyces]|uniref:IS110 family transposase n=1 Tax=Streptomyces lycopersici TaxID=2974589 RepID=UPI0021CE27A4|nr:IS110 family transposase [Streptomyces sp. NEAU-383]